MALEYAEYSLWVIFNCFILIYGIFASFQTWKIQSPFIVTECKNMRVSKWWKSRFLRELFPLKYLLVQFKTLSLKYLLVLSLACVLAPDSLGPCAPPALHLLAAFPPGSSPAPSSFSAAHAHDLHALLLAAPAADTFEFILLLSSSSQTQCRHLPALSVFSSCLLGGIFLPQNLESLPFRPEFYWKLKIRLKRKSSEDRHY